MEQPHNNEIRGIRQKVQIAISDGISFLLRRTRELALPNLTWILTLLIVYAIPVWGAGPAGCLSVFVSRSGRVEVPFSGYSYGP